MLLPRQQAKLARGAKDKEHAMSYGSPQVLHNSGRLAWGSGPKGETPAYTGVDFIIARDGKIAALYVYLDSPPT